MTIRKNFEKKSTSNHKSPITSAINHAVHRQIENRPRHFISPPTNEPTIHPSHARNRQTEETFATRKRSLPAHLYITITGNQVRNVRAKRKKKKKNRLVSPPRRPSRIIINKETFICSITFSFRMERCGAQRETTTGRGGGGRETGGEDVRTVRWALRFISW